MLRLRTLCLGAAAVFVLAAAAPAFAALPASNPFAQPSTLPYQAPPFDRIKDTDYQPALEEGMTQQIAEIQAIANNPAPPTFENTIVAMEKSGRLLDRVQLAFSGVVQANTNDTLDKVQTAEAPKLAAHQDAIFLNPKLFARVKAITDSPAAAKLDAESRQLLKIYYMQFVHSGARLNDADKQKLREQNTEPDVLKVVAAAIKDYDKKWTDKLQGKKTKPEEEDENEENPTV